MLEKPLYGQSRADDKYKDGFANIVDDYIWNNWKLPKKQGGGNLNIQEWNGIIMRQSRFSQLLDDHKDSSRML